MVTASSPSASATVMAAAVIASRLKAGLRPLAGLTGAQPELFGIDA